MSSITMSAYAKINLSLDILGTRPDGYHEVRMLMQSLLLHDTLVLRQREEPGITLTCSDASLPTDEHNLAYRAAAVFLDRFPASRGIDITLTKVIPCAAGLAGGSSDAAAVLHAMNHLYRLPASAEVLAELGLTLGADVPYCLRLGTALAEGIGEHLTSLPAAPQCCCVLVKPDAGASTRQIYQNYDALAALGGIRHPDTDSLLLAIREGNYPLLCKQLCNVLEPVTAALIPEVDMLRQRLFALGADGARMSGSGPTVFGLFSEKSRAVKAVEELQQTGYANALLTGFYFPDSFRIPHP